MRNRREFTGAAVATLLWAPGWSGALSLSNADAVAGLREALQRGAASAVDQLSQADGFLGNPKVRIPLPRWIEKSAKLLKLAGQQDKVEALSTAMNRAAEAAVPEAKALLVQAVRTMTVADAKRVLTGGDTAATTYFSERTRASLGARFLPIVTRATEKVQLAQQYNTLASRFAGKGLIKGDNVSIEKHVTAKALDGLYVMIGEEEQRIRKDPIGTGSALLGRVFSSF
jgi:Protein of unknown function (DUF4197)